VRSFSEAGLPAQTTERLGKGVNDNLVKLIEQRHPNLGQVKGNRGHGKGTRPDFRFGPAGSTAEVMGEVKAIYDLTMPSFYGHKDRHGVTDDRDKLLTARAGGFVGELFQVVFFAQLPRFEYPPGCWYGPAWKHCALARRQYAGYRGIDAQFRYLRTFITDDPTTGAGGPVTRRLGPPSSKVLDAMSCRFSAVFRPDDDKWVFDPQTHLVDAAVGYAVWQY
jgi:hypothetical protein